MNDNKKTKTKTTKAIIAAATIMAVVASAPMIGTKSNDKQRILDKYSTP
jgi:hypothetical protein